jgi:hypothetical protein
MDLPFLSGLCSKMEHHQQLLFCTVIPCMSRQINWETAVFLLEFSKAFDELSWTFLKEVLEKKNLSTRWISWMATIYGSDTISILVIGTLTPSFALL